MLDSFHRRQLSQVLGVKWPHKIRCKKLYEQTETKPISIEITKRRWKLLGHTLPMEAESPARKAMKFFFEKESILKFRGQKRASIFTTLDKDIIRTKERHPSFDIPELKSELDLHNTRVKATNRRLWTKRDNLVVNAAYSNMS